MRQRDKKKGTALSDALVLRAARLPSNSQLPAVNIRPPALPYRATGVPQTIPRFLGKFHARNAEAHGRQHGSVALITKLILVPIGGELGAAAGQPPGQRATIHGLVVDARTRALCGSTSQPFGMHWFSARWTRASAPHFGELPV